MVKSTSSRSKKNRRYVAESLLHVPGFTLVQGEIYVKYDSVDSAKRAIDSLNGRWFGGRQIFAAFISDAIMQAHQ